MNGVQQQPMLPRQEINNLITDSAIPSRIFCDYINVYTYISVMKLEQAIQTGKFSSDKHKAVLNILYRAWIVKTKISRELKPFGMSHEQYNVLRILKGSYPNAMRVKDIGSRLIEKSSNVPRIIDKLEDKKMVQRLASPEDNRETLINLTASGIKILEASTRSMQPNTIQSLPLTEKEAALLNQLLDKIIPAD
jgi:DNA-binding MarR family transcriptional regulator